MKKISILLFTLFTTTLFFGQVLLQDNFNSYNLGNLGTQGGWSRIGGNSSEARIANITPATYGKSFQFAQIWAGRIQVFKNFDWASRNSGNNTLKVQYHLYTGMGVNKTAGQIYSNVKMRNLIGKLEYDAGSSEIRFYSSNTASNGELIMSNVFPSTWYQCEFTYDFTSGKSFVKINGNRFGPFLGIAGESPDEFSFESVFVDPTQMMGYDNLIVSAFNQNFSTPSKVGFSKINIYPNPVIDVVNIQSDQEIEEIQIINSSGKTVLKSTSNTINASFLNSGIYILEIKYKDGSRDNKKIIKK